MKFFTFKAAMQVAKSLSAYKKIFFATNENCRAVQIPFNFINIKLTISIHCFNKIFYAVFGEAVFSDIILFNKKIYIINTLSIRTK